MVEPFSPVEPNVRRQVRRGGHRALDWNEIVTFTTTFNKISYFNPYFKYFAVILMLKICTFQAEVWLLSVPRLLSG